MPKITARLPSTGGCHGRDREPLVRRHQGPGSTGSFGRTAGGGRLAVLRVLRRQIEIAVGTQGRHQDGLARACGVALRGLETDMTGSRMAGRMPRLRWRKCAAVINAARAGNVRARPPSGASGKSSVIGRRLAGLATGWLRPSHPGTRHFGARIITICRPSRRGNCSTLALASNSVRTRSSTWAPSSWCTISRPRKRKRDLDLVAFFQEARHRAHLDLVVVLVDAGPQLDLLDLDHLLLLARLVLLLLLPGICTCRNRGSCRPADRRWARSRPDRARPRSAICSASRIGATPTIGAVFLDEPDGGHGDLAIDARAIADDGRGLFEGNLAMKRSPLRL